MSQPLFITFEGPEGSGKSTQLKLLAARLREAGKTVSETREPGGTRIGMDIRKILLNPENQELAQMAELLLMYASRAQNLKEFIQPALAQGHIVLCDRFSDSTVAYQGGARGMDLETIHTLNQMVTDGMRPDLTILLDVGTELGLKRAHSRNQQMDTAESRFDDEAVSFHTKVRASFLESARQNPDRIRVVDGSGSQDDVAEAVWSTVTTYLK